MTEGYGGSVTRHKGEADENPNKINTGIFTGGPRDLAVVRQVKMRTSPHLSTYLHTNPSRPDTPSPSLPRVDRTPWTFVPTAHTSSAGSEYPRHPKPDPT